MGGREGGRGKRHEERECVIIGEEATVSPQGTVKMASMHELLDDAIRYERLLFYYPHYFP